MLWPFLLITLPVSAAPGEPPLHARFVSPLVKVRPGAVPGGDLSARLTAARGECEAVQLVVAPPTEDVEVSAAPLKGAKGEVALRVYQEEYLDLAHPSNA